MCQSPAELAVAERFTADTADYILTVVHEHGEYLHLRFHAPGQRWESTGIHAWPGGVVTSGDMASGFLFERRLPFFERGNTINPRYWAEKLESSHRGREVEFSAKVLQQSLDDELADEYDIPEWCRGQFLFALNELRDDVKRDVDNIPAAQEHLSEWVFECEDADERRDYAMSLSDVHEIAMTDFTWHYLWACHVLRTAARLFYGDGDQTRVIRSEAKGDAA
jgi:hypothetical protein